MSTHVPGFQSSSRFFALFCIGQISEQHHKGYGESKGSKIFEGEMLVSTLSTTLLQIF